MTESLQARVAEALEVDLSIIETADVAIDIRDLGPEETLVERGDPVDDVFVILDGELEVHGFDDQMLAVLEPGAVVGEVAVMAGGRRTATVRAGEGAKVAVVGAQDFERLIALSPDLYHRISDEAIRRLDHRWLMEFITWLLGPIDPAMGDAISRAVSWRRLDAGEYLYRRGDKADGGFAVIRGRLRMLGQDGKAREVGKGTLVGEEGLVADVERSDSALALRDSVVVEVPRDTFLSLIETFPKVVASVLANLMKQRAGLKRSTRRTATTILAPDPVLGDRAGRNLVDQLGDSALMSSDQIDRLLDKPGVAQSPHGTPGDVRLSQLLHELEHGSGHTVYLADSRLTEWSRRVIRQSDNVLIVVDGKAASSDLESIDELTSQPWLGRSILAVFHSSLVERPIDTARFTAKWSPDMVVHVRHDGDGVDRLARLLDDRATGLVLGGGGARGFAHMGVWRALQEHGVEVDLIGGASMGAVMGALLARGVDLDDLEEEVSRLFVGLLDYTLPLVSLIKGKRVAKGLMQSMGDWDIEDLWLPFFCTSTNLTHSQVLVHDRGSLARAVRASSSIPGVFPPTNSGSDLLVDSGLLNNLPADVMRDRIPHGTVIAVDVAPPVGPGAHADLGMSLSATQALRSRLSPGKPRHPRLIPILLRSMITASMRERDEAIQEGTIDLYLDLDMRGISLLDFEQANRVIRAGYEASAPRIEAWLEERNG